MSFDPHQKEQQLRQEALGWDTSDAVPAADGDVPVLDLTDYFTTGSQDSLCVLADQLRTACEEVGFFSMVGHQIPESHIQHTFAMVKRFHEDLSLDTKLKLQMDRTDWPVGGVGYLPVKHRKLPTREKGNLNEAFIIKRDQDIGLNDNQWPEEEGELAGFRQAIEDYANTMTSLARKILPLFATALDMPLDFFDEAFQSPLYRLRMTRYPPEPTKDADEFGIPPHVDTSFCTILAQEQPGLTIFCERRQCWIQVPLLENALVVNVGELLRQWTNDRFLSVKHFADNNQSDSSRYAIPFFWNANSTYTMHCIPSCCGPQNPAKYPPISYRESQGVVQGE